VYGEWIILAFEVRISLLVAQISNLPYRRLPVGRPQRHRPPCGLEIRDTAGWKPALPKPRAQPKKADFYLKKGNFHNKRNFLCPSALTSKRLTLV
jgi:hypothetical protein